MQNVQTPQQIALIGLGTVGLGWAATYLANGYSVRAYDPAHDAIARTTSFLEATWPTLAALGIARENSPPLAKLLVVASEAEAVQNASLIHENGPENVQVKRAIFETIENHARENAVIAS